MGRYWLFLAAILKKRSTLLLEFLVSLCLAFLIWLYAHSRAESALDNVSVPVVIQLPQGQQDKFELEVQGSRQVTASFSGPSSRIRELRRMLQRGLVKAAITCTIGEERSKESRFSEAVVVEPRHITVPPGVMTVLTDEGNDLQVILHRIIERTLPVRFEHNNEARVRNLLVEPAMVVVRGPKEILDRAHFVPTQPHMFTPTPEGTVEDKAARGQVNLVTELEGRPITTRPELISFSCRVQPRQKIYELLDVPVHFLCPAGFPWRARFAADQPSKVTLRIIGPPLDEVPLVSAYVDLSKGNYNRGRNLEPVRIQLPRDFELVPEGPKLISFHLDDLDKIVGSGP